MAVHRLHVEDRLGRVGVAVRDRARVDRQPERVIPRAAVEVPEAGARQHARVALDRGDVPGPVPPAWVTARRQPSDMGLRGDEVRRRGVGVDRVSELGLVGRGDGRLDLGGQQRERLPERGRVRVDDRRGRARRRVEAQERCTDPAEREPRRGGLQVLQRLRRALGCHRRRAAPAVDVDEAGEITRARGAVEVPGRVRGRHRAAERVPAEDHAPPVLVRRLDDAVQVLHLDVETPAARVGDVGVGDQLEVVGHRRVREPAEVVVEQGLIADLALLVEVQDRVVLELVLPPLDRPHLPRTPRPAHDVLRQGQEVRRSGRRARVQHEHVPGPRRADLQHADAVQGVRGGRIVMARHPAEADLTAGREALEAPAGVGRREMPPERPGARGGQRHHHHHRRDPPLLHPSESPHRLRPLLVAPRSCARLPARRRGVKPPGRKMEPEVGFEPTTCGLQSAVGR